MMFLRGFPSAMRSTGVRKPVMPDTPSIDGCLDMQIPSGQSYIFVVFVIRYQLMDTPSTMHDDEVQRAVFRFKRQHPSATQSAAFCGSIKDALGQCVAELVGVENHTQTAATDDFNQCVLHRDSKQTAIHVFSAQERVWLRYAWRQLDTAPTCPRVGDVWTVAWFPEYGGVLQAELFTVDTVALRVLALDEWEWTRHFLPNGESVDSAVPRKHVVLSCGRLPLDILSEFEDKLTATMATAKDITGTMRSAAAAAANGATGHQRTPQFLIASVRSVLSEVRPKSDEKTQHKSRGGITDVGLHAGGAPRDTCWPLVCAALRQATPRATALADKLLLAFYSYLFDQELEQVEAAPSTVETGAFWNQLDRCFEMLEKIVACALALVNDGYDGSGIIVTCERWRERLDQRAAEWTRTQAEAFTLPVAQRHRREDEIPKLKAPQQKPFRTLASENHSSLAIAGVEAKQFAFLAPTRASKLLKHLETLEVDDKIRVRHAVHLIEAWLLQDQAPSLSQPLAVDEDERDLAVLLDIVEWHRNQRDDLDDSEGDETVRMEQQSVYAVVSWVSFCLAHRLVCREFPEAARHRIALDPLLLDVCVLRDRAARVAVGKVAAYIMKHNAQAMGQPLFDLSNHEGTLTLAGILSKSRPEYHDTLAHVQRQWHEVCASQWSAISIQKINVRVMEQELASYNASLADMRKQLKVEEDRLRWQWQQDPRNYGKPPSFLSSWQTEVYIQEVSRLSELVKRRTAATKDASQMPEFLLCPLPSDVCQALQVLFLIAPPWQIDALAGLCWNAQRALAPKASTAVVENPTASSWREYFEQSVGAGGLLTAPSDILTAYPAEMDIPTSYGPTSINDVHTEEAFVASCVWYPTAVGSRVMWMDPVESAWVNPFLATQQDMQSFFTPRLPSTHDNRESSMDIQWMVQFPDESRCDRGNRTYAQRCADETRVKESVKQELDVLGGIRSYPYQQLRRLFGALEEDTLDLSDPVVSAVLKQALYQVGEMHVRVVDDISSHVVSFQWHSDLTDRANLQQICSVVRRLAQKIHRSPRRWKCLPLLIDIATYVGQSGTDAVTECCSLLAHTAREWAQAARIERQQSDRISDQERQELRTRECLLYGFAILAFDGNHPLRLEDVSSLCELVVLFNHAKSFVDEEKSEDLSAVAKRVARVMIRRIADMVTLLNADANHMSKCLTKCCRLVYSHVPARLNWKMVKGAKKRLFTTVFTAKSSPPGHAFTVNLFTGAVASNGNHPSRLPEPIKSHPTYQRLFRWRDFEVLYTNGIYTALHPFNSRWYRFHLINNGEEDPELLIEEEGVEGSRPGTAMQLCGRKWSAALAGLFPARLATLHSHWYWLERGVVLLRGLEVTDIRVSFVVCFEDSDRARCYEVPRHSRGLSYDSIVNQVESYPFVIVAVDQLLKVFGKFEDPRFIHTMRSQDGRMEISLPRYGLRFLSGDADRITAVGHRGFVLNKQQQLRGQMHRFHQYLLLESEHGDESIHKSRRLLVPRGTITTASDGEADDGIVGIDISTDPAAEIEAMAIDEHPRLGVFVPETLESRLQLAAIYAASSNILPWPDMKMTGGEAALELLRGCTPSRPFSPIEIKHVLAIGTQFAYRVPTLTLLAAILVEKSRQLYFLFNEASTPTIDVSDALDYYRYHLSDDRLSRLFPARQRLTPAEERELFGSAIAAHVFHAREVGPKTLSLDHLEVPQLSDALPEVISSGDKRNGSVRTNDPPRFPLAPHGTNAMSSKMVHELQESWDAFHRHNPQSTGHPHTLLTTLKPRIRDLLQTTRRDRCLLFESLAASIVRAHCDQEGRLLRAVSCVPELMMVDVMRIVLDEHALSRLSPCVDTAARQSWRVASTRLLELCVQENRLERLLESNSHAHEVLEELKTLMRAWQTADHPYWLVFEVEGRLQIRPEQYVVAKHLLENPGSICQLNMGRGKTRVILPMLFLHYSYSLRGAHPEVAKVVRAHFLSPLMSETRELMWRVLTAGVSALPFVELPFNRTCVLRPSDVRMLHHVLREAKYSGAVVMVAPECRLSLELARVEMQRSSQDPEMLRALDKILEPTQYIDVFDESDALLHHSYHLVYAIGASSSLEHGPSRWLAAEALFRVLVSPSSTRVRRVLSKHVDYWSSQAEYRSRCPGDNSGSVYNGFRLHSTHSGDGPDAAIAELRVALVEDLMDHAGFDFEWLRLLNHKPTAKAKKTTVRDLVIQIITDRSIDAKKVIQRLPAVLRHVQHQILALRGLLAYGVLENSLQKRYRVEYGHAPPGTHRKALAVPYQAADLPSEQSEFSHPDVGIVLTLLSFYHSGLSDDQMRRAFEVLLSLDEAEGAKYYYEWFMSIGATWKQEEERVLLATLDQISFENAEQFALVCSTYRYSIEVINFYVNFCVFPKDTRQFPQRMSRSAWDLVRGRKSIGFSGTNDTHYLLPLAVTQREPDDPLLRGTNGKMIQLLLDATQGFVALTNNEDRQQNQWQVVLSVAMEKDCHAVIDSGALLAGVSNEAAARFVMAQPGFKLQGVTYYDTRPQFDSWVVVEKDRNVVHFHKNSSLRECDTFVLFDEARARGSDMKLLPEAVALLTLGPDLTKDKLMQGAGRLRRLGKHQQTLWLTSTDDVYKRIRRQRTGKTKPSTPAVTTIQVLNWVLDNTQRQCTLGLLEWAQSGIQFHAKEAAYEQEFQADDWSLEGLYASGQSRRLIDDIVLLNLAKREAVAPRSTDTLKSIANHSAVYGRQDTVHVSSMDEECERELQIEEEQQENVESSQSHVNALAEVSWNWSVLLDAFSVHNIASHPELGIPIMSLWEAALQWFLPLECSEVAWHSTNVYGTANFWATVSVDDESSAFVWNKSMRQVHAMVVFADHTVLLLSEFEEHAVLKLLKHVHHRGGADQWQFALVQLPFVVGALARMESPLMTDSIPLDAIPLSLRWPLGRYAGPSVPFVAVVAGMLLNGETELFLDSHPAVAGSILATLLARVRRREVTLQSFIAHRGYPSRWKRSPLHALAKSMDLLDVFQAEHVI